MVKRSISLLVLLLTLTMLGYGQAPAHKTTVWDDKENGIYAHFVYGLTVTRKGSILAFAEARITTGADDGAHHIVCKRSTDRGETFSPSQTIAESVNGQSWSNPTVVQDKTTGTVFLFYALNHENASTEIFYKTSTDDGASWSEAKAVTPLFTPNQHDWTFHLPGPGHGIQTKSGRLVVSVWHRKAITFAAAQRGYGVNCLYSDDHGQTWSVGGDTPVGELNESQVVEKKNGDLLLFGRTINGSSGSHQATVLSNDGGKTWSQNMQYDPALTGRVCDIGLTAYSLKSKTYLVSQPANLSQRKDLTVRMSKDEGKTWPIAKLLEPGEATYSDLAVLPDGDIICLYGQGTTGHMPAKVLLARFNSKWLTQTSE